MGQYKVYLYSRDGSYDDFPEMKHDWFLGHSVRYDHGTIVTDSCAGVEYDMQVSMDGKPLGATSSEDDYFFMRVKLVLNELGEPVP